MFLPDEDCKEMAGMAIGMAVKIPKGSAVAAQLYLTDSNGPSVLNLGLTTEQASELLAFVKRAAVVRSTLDNQLRQMQVQKHWANVNQELGVKPEPTA